MYNLSVSSKLCYLSFKTQILGLIWVDYDADYVIRLHLQLVGLFIAKLLL